MNPILKRHYFLKSVEGTTLQSARSINTRINFYLRKEVCSLDESQRIVLHKTFDTIPFLEDKVLCFLSTVPYATTRQIADKVYGEDGRKAYNALMAILCRNKSVLSYSKDEKVWSLIVSQEDLYFY